MQNLYFFARTRAIFDEAEDILDILHSNIALEYCEIDSPGGQEDIDTISWHAAHSVNIELSAEEYPFIVESTGLRIDSLRHMPGPYVKWFDNQTIINMIKFSDNKAATAVSVVTLIRSGGDMIHFRGELRGEIVPQNNFIWASNHNWSAIFRPYHYGTTLNKLANKNAISHRYHAMSKLVQFMRK